MLELGNGLKLLLDPVKHLIHSCFPTLLPPQILLDQALIGVCLAPFWEFLILDKILLSHEAAQVADDDLLPFNKRLVSQFLLLTNYTVLNPLGDFPLPLGLDGVIDCLDLATEGSLKRLSDFDERVLVYLVSLAQLAEVVVIADWAFESDSFYGVKSTLIANSRVL